MLGDHFHETMGVLVVESPFRQVFKGAFVRNARRVGDSAVEAEICTGTGHEMVPRNAFDNFPQKKYICAGFSRKTFLG
jgi:hypothetical protein